MKNLRSITSKSTLLLLAASAAFMFSGCNSTSANMASAPIGNASVKSKQQQTPTDTKKPTEASDTPQVETVASKVTEAQRQEFLDAINAARAETQDCGTEGIFGPAPALTWSNELDNAAYEHSMDMAESDTFSHTGSGTKSDITAIQERLSRGSKFYERIKHNGYTNYHNVGENIAAGYDNTQEVIDAWIDSDHHCANMMSKKYTEVGMVLIHKSGTKYGFYSSQEFGGR